MFGKQVQTLCGTAAVSEMYPHTRVGHWLHREGEDRIVLLMSQKTGSETIQRNNGLLSLCRWLNYTVKTGRNTCCCGLFIAAGASAVMSQKIETTMS